MNVDGPENNEANLTKRRVDMREYRTGPAVSHISFRSTTWREAGVVLKLS